MIAEVEQADGSYVDVEHGDPVCGEDFCDKCGDCLHCYGDGPCFDGSEQLIAHRWVIYL